jgi:hypothetical protein
MIISPTCLELYVIKDLWVSIYLNDIRKKMKYRNDVHKTLHFHKRRKWGPICGTFLLFKGFHLATCGIQPSGSIWRLKNESRAGMHSCPAIRQCSSFPVSLNDRRVYPHSWWCLLFVFPHHISASSLMFFETPNKPRFVSVAQVFIRQGQMRTPRLSLHIRRSGKS